MSSTMPLPTPPVEPECVSVVVPVKRKRAKRTKVQRDAAKENTAVMTAAIEQKREEYSTSIKDLAFEYNRSASSRYKQGYILTHLRSPDWMALQLYAGGKLMSHGRKDSLYNAYMFDQAQTLKDSESKSEVSVINCKAHRFARGTNEWAGCPTRSGKR